MSYFYKPVRALVFFAATVAALSFFLPSVRAESVSLRSEDANWIANMIFQNECQMKNENLISWNEGEDFLSLGIGHFIWYPRGRSDRYRESFPELIRDLRSDGLIIPGGLLEMIQNGPPWKTREEFLSARAGSSALQLREFLKKTMNGQARFMIRRFQQALLKMIRTTPPEQRVLLTEKIFELTQTRNGLYAMIDYLNFKGDGLSQAERYREHGWGLFQVLYEMKWPVGAQGAEAEFVAAARKVLRRRVDNAPSERQEDRWIKGWENRLETYSAPSDSFKFSPAAASGMHLSETTEPIEILSRIDFTVKS